MADKIVADDESRIAHLDGAVADEDNLQAASEDELLAVNVEADSEIAYQRARKAAVQAEIDRRHIGSIFAKFTDKELDQLGITVRPKGIPSAEAVGTPGAN